MPNRILKESINESRGLSETSPFAQDLYKRLITYADDYGRFNADTEIMRARLFPRELDAVTEEDIMEALFELVGVGKIQFYMNRVREDFVYGAFPNWEEHQRIRNTRAKCPTPDDYEINDWALRRCVPIKLKVAIFERDHLTCQQCGRDFSMPGMPTKQAIRIMSGALHIDHIVPVTDGGRATMENLRLLCAKCNLSRPRIITIADLLEAAANNPDPVQHSDVRRKSQQPAARRSESRLESNPIQSNPIRIQSNHVATAVASTLQTESFAEDSPEMALVTTFRGLLVGNNPTTKAATMTPAACQRWASDFDKLIRLDGRDPPTIEAVMRWAQADTFWRANILSPAKLRAKWDTLWLQMQRPMEGKRNGTTRGRTPTDTHPPGGYTWDEFNAKYPGEHIQQPGLS